MAEHYAVLKDEMRSKHVTLTESVFGRHEAVTIFVAPEGSRYLKDDGTYGESIFGHVFIGAAGVDYGEYGNPIYRKVSLGFSPGSDFSSNHDNISYNDHSRYPDASTLTIIAPTRPDLNQNLFRIYDHFQSGKATPDNYSLMFNDCIDFLAKIAKAIGISGLELALTPNQILKNLKFITDKFLTPLIIDLDGDGVELIDFDNSGYLYKTDWVSPDDGLLVLDKNGDGIITNGNELFGGNSKIGNDQIALDGFHALSILDSNNDKMIDNLDEKWSELKIWKDVNSDRISQETELITLNDLDIKSINLEIEELDSLDNSGNLYKLYSKVHFNNKDVHEIVDVFFRDKSSDEEVNFIEPIDAKIPPLVSYPAMDVNLDNSYINVSMGIL
ncbi:hypothetical protein [Actinobacillus capsulatus]|uniref:hypothetical protein n=1 Tax=Actinobacillus capsulatus TaxID=717 RepID=UPI000382D2E8|nr:hypothetical protein [Actinobacillus capsulatus]